MSITATGATPGPRGGGRGVLEAAFALLGALEQVDGAGVTRLAAQCGLPKSTAHRLLEQLSTLGAVERGRGGYRIGARVFQLGHGWQPHPGLRAAARAPMRRLATATGATVTVSVLRDGRELIVDWAPGEGGAPVPLRRGATWPWYTAAGKALAAGTRGWGWGPEAPTGIPAAGPGIPLGTPGIPAVAPRIPSGSSGSPGAPGTPTAAPMRPAVHPPGLPAPAPSPPGSWPQEAAMIRAHGVAFDREQIVSGVCCVAVPLYGSPGAGPPVAALSVITDPSRHLDRLADAARCAGAAVGAALRAGGRVSGTAGAPGPTPRLRPRS